MSGVKHDHFKADYTYFDGIWPALEACLHLLRWGHEEKGYPKFNWETVELDRYRSAMYRHLACMSEYQTETGKDWAYARDKESNFLHLTHNAVNALFMLSIALRGIEHDDGI